MNIDDELPPCLGERFRDLAASAAALAANEGQKKWAEPTNAESAESKQSNL